VEGKKILLGVTAGIAAYKSTALIRLWVKAGADVRVILTPDAHEFVTPLTLATVSKNPVLTHFSNGPTGEWNNHVSLGLWADMLVIAPATANTLAKMAMGLCDNLLLATYLSARCPVMAAPAMDVDMWQHPATQRNLHQLTQDGVWFVQPREGELASGLVGMGRMAEPEEIFEAVAGRLQTAQTLAGKTALVTAGPTQEAIDPVRYISNHSSGKMGYAIATALADHGARVHLISGPTALPIHHPNINVERVQSAAEMFAACSRVFPSADISVFAAAVADYRPARPESQKIKKQDSSQTLELTRNPDIAAELGKQKRPGQITVGFALETENEEANAREKLKRKNLDLIVLNSLNDAGAGFGGDTNRIKILNKKNEVLAFDLKSKHAAARDIVQAIIQIAHA
jgi:phosphopantothenoylcysteine decarboxylase/phosphopantothenate--cysteine ligase